jgi:hypothetical protein
MIVWPSGRIKDLVAILVCHEHPHSKGGRSRNRGRRLELISSACMEDRTVHRSVSRIHGRSLTGYPWRGICAVAHRVQVKSNSNYPWSRCGRFLAAGSSCACDATVMNAQPEMLQPRAILLAGIALSGQSLPNSEWLPGPASPQPTLGPR